MRLIGNSTLTRLVVVYFTRTTKDKTRNKKEGREHEGKLRLKEGTKGNRALSRGTKGCTRDLRNRIKSRGASRVLTPSNTRSLFLFLTVVCFSCLLRPLYQVITAGGLEPVVSHSTSYRFPASSDSLPTPFFPGLLMVAVNGFTGRSSNRYYQQVTIESSPTFSVFLFYKPECQVQCLCAEPYSKDQICSFKCVNLTQLIRFEGSRVTR